jgi:hypothetical protein
VNRKTSRRRVAKVIVRLPVRTRMLSDELISSWLTRFAHQAFGMTPAQFVWHVCRRQLAGGIYRLDVGASRDVIEILAARAGTTITALAAGMLPHPGTQTGDSWLLRVGRMSRTSENEEAGWIQYCPGCLAEDKTPYFRRRWRIVVSTCCPRHGILLADRCPVCERTLSRDTIRTDCCGRPLADAPSTAASPLGLLAQRWLDDRLSRLGMSSGRDEAFALIQKLSIAARHAATACWVRPARAADMLPAERHVILPWLVDRKSSAAELEAHLNWLDMCGGRLLRECADLHDACVRQELRHAAERNIVEPGMSPKSIASGARPGGLGSRSRKRTEMTKELEAYWRELFSALTAESTEAAPSNRARRRATKSQ